MAEQDIIADQPFFQPRPGVDGLTSRYVLWRLAEKTVVVASGCWEWTGSRTPNGYARLSIRLPEWPESSALLHRISYSVCIGPIPEGMCVLHRCDNPPCINPAHLFLGSQADNVADKVGKGRQSRGQTVRRNHAHLKGEVVMTSRLTAEQVMGIRRADIAGENLASIASRFGISSTHASYVIQGKAWAHLPVLRVRQKKFHRVCPGCGQQIDARLGRFKLHLESCSVDAILGKD